MFGKQDGGNWPNQSEEKANSNSGFGHGSVRGFKARSSVTQVKVQEMVNARLVL